MLEELLPQIRACQLCAAHLPHGPRPVLRASASAKLMIVGQAPGTKVHASGIPWDDQSGKRLRTWLGLTPDEFYNEAHIAIVPTAFCYPGTGRSGDLPPRPECFQHWHPQLLPLLPNIQLTLLIGTYAQKAFLGSVAKATLTQTVEAWQAYLPKYLPLPHPSPRNIAWFKKHPWFEREVVPTLQEIVQATLPG
ncbi:uracil-DNA glycosylase family protein [Rufibacter sp. XAAS-G3-1]|uniref:uracil-DNA glycosylase family protein n=1 Tax=Rufibacter sp. XAAS-G3-1 TaxID=2729134 RepID=UPI0015E7555A|nr:uracil-DNA glycosylase family protein [Rufibacter sp. XAAS-G3-1]